MLTIKEQRINGSNTEATLILCGYSGERANKVGTISDKMSIENSCGISLTETWLSDENLDAEIRMDGFDLFRSDRCGRTYGGVALYLKSELCGKLSLQYSNGTVEVLIVKVKKIDTIFVTIYRPPNTQTED